MSQSRSRLPLLLFLACILLPLGFEVAGLYLTPIRLLLMVTILPFMWQVASGQHGRFTKVDALMLLCGFWVFLSLVVTQGTGSVPFAGITAVEFVGGYFSGRVLVRNSEDYRRLFKAIFVVFICLIPLVIYEHLTGKLLIPDLLRPLFTTPTRDGSARGRMGLERVQMVFEHPILWGMFCSLTVANFIMVFRNSGLLRLFAVLLSIWLTMTALSSGPLMACAIQIGILTWGWIMRGRWWLLAGLVVLAYVSVDLASNRTPIRIIISSLTFNVLSAYTRIAQFEACIEVVKDYPLFGYGMRDCPKPAWVNDSIDNFWLVLAVRHGVIPVFALFGAFLTHLWLSSRVKIADPMIKGLRIGHLVGLIAVCFVLVTVHIWGGVAVFVVFYLGAGAWLYTSPIEQEEAAAAQADEAAEPERSGSMYTRFARSHTRDQSGSEVRAQARDQTLTYARPPAKGRETERR